MRYSGRVQLPAGTEEDRARVGARAFPGKPVEIICGWYAVLFPSHSFLPETLFAVTTRLGPGSVRNPSISLQSISSIIGACKRIRPVGLPRWLGSECFYSVGPMIPRQDVQSEHRSAKGERPSRQCFSPNQWKRARKKGRIEQLLRVRLYHEPYHRKLTKRSRGFYTLAPRKKGVSEGRRIVKNQWISPVEAWLKHQSKMIPKEAFLYD